MKYAIVESNDIEELQEEVMKNLESGWILCGGMVVDSGVFYQTIRHGSDGAVAKPEGVLSGLGKECGICGKVGCTNKLHTDIAAIIPLIAGLKNK